MNKTTDKRDLKDKGDEAHFKAATLVDAIAFIRMHAAEAVEVGNKTLPGILYVIGAFAETLEADISDIVSGLNERVAV